MILIADLPHHDPVLPTWDASQHEAAAIVREGAPAEIWQLDGGAGERRTGGAVHHVSDDGDVRPHRAFLSGRGSGTEGQQKREEQWHSEREENTAEPRRVREHRLMDAGEALGTEPAGDAFVLEGAICRLWFKLCLR